MDEPVIPGEALVPTTEPSEGVLARRPDLASAARNYINAAEAENTTRARKADWKVFSGWCETQRVVPLPATPETVAAFLADQSAGEKKAVATVFRYAASIASFHRNAECPDPTKHEAVVKMLAGMKRSRGIEQKQKAALDVERVREILPAWTESPMDVRDRALLLFGLHTAMRRAEICSINIEDLKPASGGLVVRLRRSKTDQEGKGSVRGLPTLDDPAVCPVVALNAWLDLVGETTGPIFRGFYRGGKIRPERMTPQVVGAIVKRAVSKIGLDARDFGGHSLRIGYVTTCRKEGLDWFIIMEQTGHKRLETVKRYTRYTPEVLEATKVREIFNKAFAKGVK